MERDAQCQGVKDDRAGNQEDRPCLGGETFK
jgi:hypothetical protein